MRPRGAEPLRGALPAARAPGGVELPLARQIRDWLAHRRARSGFSMRRIPFSASREWSFEGGRIVHRTGRFFSIDGLRAASRFPGLESWEQPIIDQPEIGILGLLAQRRGGVWRLLVQAKTEPGNEGVVQLAPTLQATASNQGRVHRGREPAHLGLFAQRPHPRAVVDQLQSEQGSRFLRKRNRNLVVVLPPGEELPHDESFRWLGVRELLWLLRLDHAVNTDCRSVLSCLPVALLDEDEELRGARGCASGFDAALAASLRAGEDPACEPQERLLAWLTGQKRRYGLRVERLPLDALSGWRVDPDAVRPQTPGLCRVVQVDVRAGDREVERWDQPIVESAGPGLVSLLCQVRRGVLHFLVQARVEPGAFDVLELTATVQCAPGDHSPPELERLHPLTALALGSPREWVRFENHQTEEGGRFLRDSTRYLVVELPESLRVSPPDNYRWLTLGQIKGLLRFPNVFTNEARSLIACLLR